MISEEINLFYGAPSIVFSSLIRSMVIPYPGCELFVADFAKIEVAVLWWLAENEPGLEILHQGEDPYIHLAMYVTVKSKSEITEKDRDLGKALILACGFGMGIDRFRKTALDIFGLTLTEEQAKKSVYAYRNVYPTIPELWKVYEQSAMKAVATPGAIVEVGKCKFRYWKDFLWIRLPSGRKLAYRKPFTSYRDTEWGSQKTLQFHAVNPKTKKWGIERTWGGTITENIVQATARDLLMYKLVPLEKAGYQVLLTVHDEVVCQNKTGRGNLGEFISILCTLPIWADKKLPLSAKGWKGSRYRK